MHIKKTLASIALVILALFAATATQAQIYSNAVIALKPDAYWPLQEAVQPPPLYIATNQGTLGALGVQGYYESWWCVTNGAGTNAGGVFGFYNSVFTMTNYIQHVAGAIGDGDTAMVAGGNGQWVYFPRYTNGVYNPSITIQVPFSVEAWVNMTNPILNGVNGIVAEGRNSIPGGAGGTGTGTGLLAGRQSVSGGFFLGTVNSPQNTNYTLLYPGGNPGISGIIFDLFNTNGTAFVQPELIVWGITSNVWYHIVATFDGTNANMYTNGVLARSVNYYPGQTNAAGVVYAPDTISPLLIGCGPGPDGGRLPGNIDEVAIYPTALSLARVSAHYTASSGSGYPTAVLADNPLIYLRLDEVAYTTIPTGQALTNTVLPTAVNAATDAGALGALGNGVYLPGTAAGAPGPTYSGFGALTLAAAPNGINGGVDVGGNFLQGNAQVLNRTNLQPMTIAYWFKGNPSDSRQRFQNIVGHSDAGWRSALDGNNGNRFNPGGGAELTFTRIDEEVQRGFYLNDNKWHFLVGVNDGASDFLYLDGVLATNGVTGNVGSTNTSNNQRDVVLGGDPQYLGPVGGMGGIRVWDGSISHVAFWSTNLTAGQVAALWDASGAPPEIQVQPQSVSTFTGYPAAFFVIALGGTNLSYQWYDAGGPLGGQTTPTNSIPSASSSDAGIYCVVGNNSVFASSTIYVTSSIVSLTVSALPPIATAPYGSAVLALNPIGYWPLNETTRTPIPGGYYYIATNSGGLGAQGNARYKTSYNNNNGAPIGGIANLNSTVVHGPGATGDGDQALVAGTGLNWAILPQVTNGVRNSSLTIKTPFSLEAWIQMTNPAYQGGYQVIVSEGRIGIPTAPGNGQISKGFSFAITQQNPGLSGGAQGRLLLDLYNTNGTAQLQPTNGVVITSNVWYHVVATFDGTNVFIYTNSVLANNTTYYPVSTNMAGLTYVPDPSTPLMIGSGPQSQDANQFRGKIDEVAIYTNILSGAQVSAHYSAGSGVSYATTVQADHPILYYRLNEKPQQMPALDLTTYTVATNYGKLASAANGLYQPGTMPASPGPVASGMGTTNAVAFDGEVSVVDVGNGNLPREFNIGRGTIPMTVIAWVKGNPTEGGNPRFQNPIGHTDNSWRFGWDGAPHFTAGVGTEVTATRPINDNQFHMVVGVYTLASNILYIDGAFNIAAAASGTGTGSPDDFLIGGDPQYQVRMYYGSVGQVAFFTNALAASDIANLYNVAGVPPFIVTQPAPALQTNNALAGLTNTMAAGGSQPLGYRWYHGTPPGGTLVTAGVGKYYYTSNSAPVLIITNLVGADSGNYYVVVTNSSGAVTSAVANATIFAEPVITGESDTNLVLFAGYDSFTFAISAFGAQPLIYYWETNGVVYATTTNNGNLSLTNLGNGLNYSTVLSNSFGMLTSAVWTPSIVAAPTAPYPVAVLNDAPLAYFRLNESGGGGNGTIAHDYVSGHNGEYTNITSYQLSPGYPNLQPTYPVVNVADSDPGIATGGGLNNQASPTLDSYAGNIPIDFATGSSNVLTAFSVEAWVQGFPGQPNNDPGLVTRGTGGGGEQYCLGATGNPNVWRFFIRDATSGGAPGATAPATLPVSGSLANNGPDGNWHHLVGVVDEFHSNVVLYVDGDLAASNHVTAGIGGILTQPFPMVIGSRQSAAANFNDQWSGNVDEVAIYNHALTQAQAQNHYYAAGIAPYVALQPLAQLTGTTNVNQGETVTVDTRFKGTPPFFIQWYDNNGGGTPIPKAGQTNATIIFTNVNSGNIGSGTWFAEATNVYGDSGQSAYLVLNVLSGPPVVLAPGLPSILMVYYGGNATLSLQGGVTGTEPFYYQWQAFGTNIQNSARVTGANTNALGIQYVQASDSGPYSVFITNSAGIAGLGTGASTNTTLLVQTVPNFNTNGLGWTLHQVTVNPTISNNVFTGTYQLGNSTASAWYQTPLYIGAFQAAYTYQDATTNAAGNIVGGGADGCVFAIQNTAAGLAAIGGGGGSLGFVGITNSVGFEINIYNGNNVGIGYGINGATFGNGAPNYTVIPGGVIAVASGRPIDCTINYNGQTAVWKLFDEVNLTSFTTNMNIGSIAALVGNTNTAYVGFTMADGGVSSIQTVSNFTFVPIPTITAAVSGSTVKLTWAVLGGYVLQQRTNLTAGSWIDIPAPYPIVNGQQEYDVPATDINHYYQLKLEVIQ